MKWISVKEKMPTELQDVLITDGNEIGLGWWEWRIGEEEGEEMRPYPERYRKMEEDCIPEWIDTTDNLTTDNLTTFLESNPTHWMRLPELPGGETNEKRR